MAGQRLLLGGGVLLIAASFAVAGIGMMGGSRLLPATAGISMDRAQAQVQAYLDRTGDKDLVIDELMEFDQNFYALVKEKSTGIGAFELLVSRATGAVRPEPGPNMMWNAKYGGMAGGMTGAGRPWGTMTVSADRATQIAESWLDQHRPGSSAGTGDAFYGYYTFHFEKDGQVAGMLSVNGQSGAVWFHTWHGGFISSKEVG